MTSILLNPEQVSLPRPPSRACYWLAALAAAAIVGCGGAQSAFSTSYADNDEQAIRAVLARIEQAPAPAPFSVALGISSEPSKLFAFDLAAGKLLWQESTDTWFSPIAAGKYAVTQESAGIVVRDLMDGKRLLAIKETGMSLRGADAQGSLIALVMGKSGGGFTRYEVVAVRNGSVAWRRELAGTAGAPAVSGDTILVPWNHQYLSALDGTTGNEIARIRVLDTVIGHAFNDRGRLYAGSDQGVFPVSEALISGSAKQGPLFSLPDRTVPGQPLLLADMYAPEPIPAPNSARHHIQLCWAPVVSGATSISLEDNNIYLVYYRFILAFDPASFKLRWIYTHPADLIGASVQTGGILFADERGEMGMIDAGSGKRQWKANSGMSTLVVRFARGASVASGVGGGEGPSTALADQLLTAAQHPDARLVPIRLMVVELLAGLKDSFSTAALIDLCENRRNTPPVRDAACAALAKREIGAEHVLEALKRHAAFLEGTTAPPVGSLAKAAARLKDTRAVSLLIAHLRDPATPSPDLAALVLALKELNDRAAVQPLIDFLRMYHADAPDDQTADALVETVDALTALSGPAAGDVLREVAADGLGHPAVRGRIRQVLEEMEKQEAEAEKSDADRQTAMEKESAAQQEPVEDQAPLEDYLSKTALDEALAPVSGKLEACLASGEQKAVSAMVLMVVYRGDILSIHVEPKALQPCIEPLIRSQTIPVTKTARERVKYTIQAR